MRVQKLSFPCFTFVKLHAVITVGLGGILGGLDVLRGVLGGVGRRVHGHAACGVLREGLLLVRTLGIRGSFSIPYLAACCLAFLAAFLALLVTSLVMDMSGTGWLETSSTMLQTWLLMQRDSLPASFLLLHIVSVLRAASWEVLRAASSEVLRAASMEVLRADSSEDRGIFCLLGGFSVNLGLDPDRQRLGLQSIEVLGGDALDDQQHHAVCQWCTGRGGWRGRRMMMMMMMFSHVHLPQPHG